jgi:hypothetical protein
MTWNSGKDFVKGDKRLVGNQYAKGNKPNQTSFKKGMVAHNKGVYSALTVASIHTWIKGIKGKPNKCEDCGTTAKAYHWSKSFILVLVPRRLQLLLPLMVFGSSIQVPD